MIRKLTQIFIKIKTSLQTFQLNRLKNTYTDFSDSSEFKDLTSFFYEQIYGPQDFGFRNESIKTIFNKSQHFLRRDIVKAIKSTIELNELSEELDNVLAERILKLEILNLDSEGYATAYRSCDNYEQRCNQIELMIDATNRVYKLSQIWMIGASLKALHTFTDILGIENIMNFLYDGYQAFHKVSDIKPFTDAVYKREVERNNFLFGISK